MMKSWSIVLIVLALLVSACGEAGNNNGRPAGAEGERTPTAETPLDLAPDGGEPAQGLLATPQAVAASMLASNLINTEVAGQNGKIGQVMGLALDAALGQARYLLVRTVAQEVERTVLLPMGAYAVALLAPDQLTEEAEILPVVWLTVPDSDLAEAPEVDAGIFTDTQVLMTGWDVEASQYWSGRGEALPVTGEGEARTAPGNLLYLSDSQVENFNVPVVDAQGEEIGQILDYVIAPNGEISYAELRLSGIEDPTSEVVAVSSDALTWDGERQAYVVTASHEALSAAPAFDRLAPPDMTIPGWDRPWDEYWQQQSRRNQTTPATEAGRQVKISHLMGLPVFDVTDVELGAVEDLILGQDGTIQYLVVRAGDLLRPVPWGDFEYNFSQGILTYLDDVTRLQEAPGFDTTEAIDTTNPQWDEQIRGYWGRAR